jgi:UTP:GlnB (protein PII) uridylyltransferase
MHSAVSELFAFKRMRLVQHEFFHEYTVDEHTLMCLERLDGIYGTNGGPHSATPKCSPARAAGPAIPSLL